MDVIAVAERAVSEHGALQKPGELARLLALLADDPPRLVLEIGADAGGTLWAWRQLGAEVLAVDLPGGPYSTGRPRNDHGATVIEGDSHDRAIWQQIRFQFLWGCLNGLYEADMVFIDGDHTFEGCTEDVHDYSPFLRPGGLLVLHDICHHPGLSEVRVDRVWQDLIRSRSSRWELIEEPTTWGGIGVLRR